MAGARFELRQRVGDLESGSLRTDEDVHGGLDRGLVDQRSAGAAMRIVALLVAAAVEQLGVTRVESKPCGFGASRRPTPTGRAPALRAVAVQRLPEPVGNLIGDAPAQAACLSACGPQPSRRFLDTTSATLSSVLHLCSRPRAVGLDRHNHCYHPASRSATACVLLTGTTTPPANLALPVPRDHRTVSIASAATHHDRWVR